jgi:HK97 family phage major capsid protein
MEFRNIVEFVAATRWEAENLRGMNITQGAGGGFLVPETFRDALLKVDYNAIVRPRATVLQPGETPDAPLSIPALRQRSTRALSGMRLQWTAEGDVKQETQAAFDEIILKPKEVSGYCTVTDKLLRNSSAEIYLYILLRSAMSEAEDEAFLTGDGVGRPLGVLNSPARVEVDRLNAGQIEYADIINMLARLIAQSWQNAVWVASVTVVPQLFTMVSPSGHVLFRPGDGRNQSFAGFPLAVTPVTPDLGQRGDLMLCDFSKYLIKDGSGPFIDSSAYFGRLFEENKSIIRATWNVDGQPWIRQPLQLTDGTEQSAFVILR